MAEAKTINAVTKATIVTDRSCVTITDLSVVTDRSGVTDKAHLTKASCSSVTYQSCITKASGVTDNSSVTDTSGVTDKAGVTLTQAHASTTEEVNWKERCLKLEASLQKFEGKATRIRTLIADQMKSLDERTQKSEKRAVDAENQVLELQLKLKSLKMTPGELHTCNKDLELRLHQSEADRKILQEQVEAERRKHIEDNNIVNEKATKIKEWIGNKLREIELENHHYKTENASLNEQVTILQKRLQDLPAQLAKDLHLANIENSKPQVSERLSERLSIDDIPPAIPARPSHSIIESLNRDHVCDIYSTVSKDSFNSSGYHRDDSVTDHSGDRLSGYRGDISVSDQSGDLLSEDQLSNYHGTTSEHDDRISGYHDNIGYHSDVNYHDNSDISCNLNSYEDPDYQEIDENHESQYKPQKHIPPRVRIARKVFYNPRFTESLNSSASMASSEEILDKNDEIIDSRPDSASISYGTPITLTPNTPPSPLTPSLPEAPPSSPLHTSYQMFDRNIAALATLPRKKKDIKHPEDHRSPIVEGMLVHSADQNAKRGTKPPPPPLHRLPSWENRIYAVARTGLQLPDSPERNRKESSIPIIEGTQSEKLFQEINTPVFTIWKGKATRIRNSPFSDNSSTDSSDNDAAFTPSVAPPVETVMSVAGPNGNVTKSPSLNTRQQVNQSSSGAIKRGVSSQSVNSESSSDYAVPPDNDVDTVSHSGSENSEPEQKLLKYSKNLRLSGLEKSGYLTKLSGKVKGWQRRWFILRDGQLLYYKSASDAMRKPLGCLPLDSQTKISKSATGTQAFEIVTSKRRLYLIAEDEGGVDSWIRVIQNALRRQAAGVALRQSNTKAVIKAWLTKAKHGKSRKYWCTLVGKYLLYYKRQSDKMPVGQINLGGCRLEEIDRTCDSESDSDLSIQDFTLALYPTQDAITYLIIQTKQEKDSWLYHLTVASGGGMGNIGTNHEQIISKLIDSGGDPGCICWKHPSVLYTREETLECPLTTLPSELLQERALHLFRNCHMFMHRKIDSPAIDYHVNMAQRVTEECLLFPELQNEIYCQLIKQTSPHPPQHKGGVQNLLLCGNKSWFMCDANPPASPSCSNMDLYNSKLNPNNTVFIQGWQLLSMCLSLFLPKQGILWFLKAHLQRNADPRTEIGKYAVFCQRALERTLYNGGRESKPSRMEVLSILLRNPFHHSQPISIPVHLSNESYQVVSFDGSTTVEEFLNTLNRSLNMRACSQSGFALFTDDPQGRDVYHCLNIELKPEFVLFTDDPQGRDVYHCLNIELKVRPQARYACHTISLGLHSADDPQGRDIYHCLNIELKVRPQARYACHTISLGLHSADDPQGRDIYHCLNIELKVRPQARYGCRAISLGLHSSQMIPRGETSIIVSS
ncbi:unnamed protein product [Owenia fusiformis]|uniref:PH domain-containing protein n=1 Tax=Owenia fusiformis TaxID=6347 RepID=A0A8S4P8S2_OWEFU|nr:unnamed protein product [Owenia fusiformis]